jgi:glucuronate isomerase
MTELALHPDRLFPTTSPARDVAREIYEQVRSLPILSPHGHLDARLFADDEPFADPASLLVTGDHYILRLLHAQGVSYDRLGVRDRAAGATGDVAAPREVWGELCRHWLAFAGTSMRLWLEHQFVELFGVHEVLRPETADATFDQIASRLASPELRPRALYERFGIEVLSTTDSPLDSLAAHRALRDDPSWNGRIVPTFRPDAVIDPATPGWARNVELLGEVTGCDTSGYRGYIEAIERRRQDFAELGATATDHGTPDLRTERLDDAHAEALFARLRRGEEPTREVELATFRAHMLQEMARMSCDDGLVMQIHPGVLRDYDPWMLEHYGADIGQDFPLPISFVEPLRPLLTRYGRNERFSVVVYTVDETTFSRDLATLASFHPALRVGAPWWFLDAPDAMRRAWSAVAEPAGLVASAGFVDDSRSLCAIPARHDVARRVAAGFLAGLVCEHRLRIEDAVQVATEYAYGLPKRVFRL